MACLLAKASAFVFLGLVRWLEIAAAAFALPSPAIAADHFAEAVPCNSGTGFFVSGEGHLLSARHVLGKCIRAAAFTRDGVRFGERIAVSDTFDVALFRFDLPTPEHAVFPVEPLNLFWAPATAVGWRSCGGPQSLRLNEAQAVAGLRQLPDTVGLMADGAIVGGNSGSPVVDAAGRVIGMLVARSRSNERVGYAVSADRLKVFLAQHGVPVQQAPEPLAALFATAGDGAKAVPFTVGVACVL
jgi:hypothetical protein